MPLNLAYEKKLISILEKCKFGEINVKTPQGHVHKIKSDCPGVVADLDIKDWRTVAESVLFGDIGFDEAYMKNYWSSSDIVALMRYFAQNNSYIRNVSAGNRIFRLVVHLLSLKNKNTIKGSRRNIIKHYDLGNDFYSLWLDTSMTYSSALYKNSDESLELAQLNKYKRILSQFNTGAKNVLEIGCGWGGFAEYAGQSGFEVDALTISPAQAGFAAERIQQSKLENVNIKIQDYRNVNGVYDAICSIEMFEAVGLEYWPKYFNQVKRLLSEKGKAVIQSIVINTDTFERYANKKDFLNKHIFPGGILPTQENFKSIARKSGLKVVDEFNFGQCYARTTRTWLENFNCVLPDVKKLGFDDVFIRKWQFYLAACSGFFKEGNNDVVQFTLQHENS